MMRRHEREIWWSGVITSLLIVHCTLSAGVGPETGVEGAESQNVTEKPGPVLTGDPQKDYIHDPNLPRELKGFNLSNYPFYKRVPNIEFNFTCDDRHDGFYASIPHECQVYHHCLFGVRYDFLCSNYTAFDQTNFICNFANEVDCANSEDYYFRNDALYKEETTTTTTTAAPQIRIVYVERERPNKRRPGGTGGRRRKTTPKPAADEYYYDDYYDEKTSPAASPAAAPAVKQDAKDTEYYYDDAYDQTSSTTTSTTTSTTSRPQLRRQRPNRPLRTRTESPISKQAQSSDYPQYDTETSAIDHQSDRSQNPSNPPQRKRRRRKKTTTTSTTTTTTTTPEPEYYEEYYYDDYTNASSTTTTTEQPLIRKRPDKASQPTAQERRQALLQSRRSTQRFVRQNPSSSQSEKQANQEDVGNTDFEYIT